MTEASTPDYKRVELVWPGKKTQVERVKAALSGHQESTNVRKLKVRLRSLASPQLDIGK